MKKTHIIILVFIAVAIGVIVANTQNYSTYETFTSAAEKPQKEFHVVGTLALDEEMTYDPQKDPNYFAFYLNDQDGVKRKVVFPGTKPQDFERSEQVVLVGKMNGDEFQASKILTKCPSKYIDDELEVKEYNAVTS